jgi:FkbM family methyltransferase
MSLFETNWFAGMVLAALSKRLRHGTDGLDVIETRLAVRLFRYFRNDDLAYAPMVRFFAYVCLNQAASIAQLQQDLWVLFMTGGRREGYFVEFGACDGRRRSNTWLLESGYGWTGILAEPNPGYHRDLAANRSCHIAHECVAARSGDEVAFECATDPTLSRMSDIVPADRQEEQGRRVMAERIMVPAITLDDLLDRWDAPAEIDYISIDTEGSELVILEAFDFSRRHVRLFTVEHNHETAKRDAIHQLMQANGFRRWFPEATQFDDWYVNEAMVPAERWMPGRDR